MVFNANMMIGGGLVGTISGVAALATVWTPFSPTRVSLSSRFQAPSSLHWLGTDEFGRDVLSRLMVGAETSIGVALTTTVVALVLGMAIGLTAGYLRGWVDRVLMSLNDTLLAFPGILFAMGLLAVIGPSKWGIVLALGLAYAPTVARVVRGSVLSLREREFIEASRALGNGAFYTLIRHIVPNTVSPMIVLATSLFGLVILSESALSFLGLGVPPPAPTWGNMLASARPHLERAPWLAIAPGTMIALCLLGANLLGDGLRDLLDPRSTR